MPRMSKKNKIEWDFYLDENGGSATTSSAETVIASVSRASVP